MARPKKKDTPRPEFNHWREWIILTNKQKTDVYPSLTVKEKENIWTKEYMKVIRLNMKPFTEGEEE